MQVMHPEGKMMEKSRNHQLKKVARAVTAKAKRNRGIWQQEDSENASEVDGGGSGSRGKITG
jgi:hypothetical protein